MPLNKEKLTDDGARDLLADWEWYVPLGEPEERFANKRWSTQRSGLWPGNKSLENIVRTDERYGHDGL